MFSITFSTIIIVALSIPGKYLFITIKRVIEIIIKPIAFSVRINNFAKFLIAIKIKNTILIAAKYSIIF